MFNFDDNDIISHYTTIETAVEHILFRWELKAARLKNSKDPFESPLLTIGWGGYHSDDEQKEKEIDNSASAISQEIKDKLKCTCYVCFCQNNYSPFTYTPPEQLGYAHPRMWAEYSNHHTGCCILFSKSRLEQYLESNFKDSYEFKEVEYCNSQVLNRNVPHVSTEIIRKHGEAVASDIEHEKLLKYIFQKHEDFTQEKELRLAIFSDKEHDIYIPINDIIKGIVISHNISSFHKEYLRKLTLEYDLQLFKIEWSYRNITIQAVHDRNRKIESMRIEYN